MGLSQVHSCTKKSSTASIINIRLGSVDKVESLQRAGCASRSPGESVSIGDQMSSVLPFVRSLYSCALISLFFAGTASSGLLHTLKHREAFGVPICVRKIFRR